MVGDDDVLRGPAAEGGSPPWPRTTSPMSPSPSSRTPSCTPGVTYELTGPEALTLSQVAATIAEVTGRDVRYHPETVEEAYKSRQVFNAPRWELDAWVRTYTSIAAGELDVPTTAVRDITGHPATSLRDLLEQL